MDAAGDTDFEGPALRLGCRLFSSSSEEMTYTTRGKILRQPGMGYAAMNLQAQIDQGADDSNRANNAKWRI